MKRRDFIASLGGAVAAWPLAARAQQTALPVVGFLNGQSPDRYAAYISAFRRGLNAGGFAEGRNVTLEYRWADGHYEKLPELARELVGGSVAVIAATGTTAAVLAAKAATTSIPIVFTSGEDPVAAGIVPSLSRPGGNITGVSFMYSETGPKRVELLSEMVPRMRSVGLVGNPLNPRNNAAVTALTKAARALGHDIKVAEARSPREIDAAFTTLVQQRVDAVIVGSDALFIAEREHVAALAAQYALPAIYTLPEQVKAGGLMSYGASQSDAYRQAGRYAASILGGEQPANLPIMLPTKYELAINLKTATALGLTVPASMLATADEVIE